MIHEPTRTEVLDENTAPDIVHQRLLDAGTLAFQRCPACACAVYPPRILCPSCGGTRLEWEPSTGNGRVYSVSTLSSRGGDSYHVALVDLDDGFRMMSNIIDADEVRIGARVGLKIVERDGNAIPVFVLEEQQ